jgi:hypothetical protein
MMASPPEAQPPAEPASPKPEEDPNGQPLMVAHGVGGRLELYHHSIRINRDGFANYFLSLLAKRPAFVDTTVAIDEVSSFDIVQPLLFNDFVSISYPGSPSLTGRSLWDSMAENALLMNFIDNREFYALKRRFQAIVGRPPLASQPRSFLRARWRRS